MSRGRPPKPAHQRLRRNKTNEVGLLKADPLRPVPKADPAWDAATAKEWRQYWRSDVSALAQLDSDLPAIRRLFSYRAELAKALEDLQITGATSSGNMVVKLEKMIVNLEDRYGLSALSRLRLGAQFGDATKSLNDMNKAFVAEVSGGNSDDDDEEGDVIDLPGLPGQR
jgi:hypothetical protein